MAGRAAPAPVRVPWGFPFSDLDIPCDHCLLPIVCDLLPICITPLRTVGLSTIQPCIRLAYVVLSSAPHIYPIFRYFYLFSSLPLSGSRWIDASSERTKNRIEERWLIDQMGGLEAGSSRATECIASCFESGREGECGEVVWLGSCAK